MTYVIPFYNDSYLYKYIYINSINVYNIINNLAIIIMYIKHCNITSQIPMCLSTNVLPAVECSRLSIISAFRLAGDEGIATHVG